MSIGEVGPRRYCCLSACCRAPLSSCQTLGAIDVPVHLDFVSTSSYRLRTKIGALGFVKHLASDIAGRHVVITQYIVDTGKTLYHLVKNLMARRPAGVRICALSDMPDCRQLPITADYVGFEIPDQLGVGYGLHFAEGYPNYPCVSTLKEHLRKSPALQAPATQGGPWEGEGQDDT